MPPPQSIDRGGAVSDSKSPDRRSIDISPLLQQNTATMRTTIKTKTAI